MEPFRTIDFKVELALNKLVFLALVKANPQLKALARNAYLSMRPVDAASRKLIWKPRGPKEHQ